MTTMMEKTNGVTSKKKSKFDIVPPGKFSSSVVKMEQRICLLEIAGKSASKTRVLQFWVASFLDQLQTLATGGVHFERNSLSCLLVLKFCHQILGN